MPAASVAPAASGLVAELAAIVGDEHVSVASHDRAERARSVSPGATMPSAIARPATREAVQAIVRAARRHGAAVHAISRGWNRGYGDACAPRPGCVLVDLSRMDRIREVDARLAYAVVEPGVTQGQLADHLRRLGAPLVADCTGAGPDASIVGNLLERGFGHSRYGDRAAHACAFEVVLADGSVVETGFAAYAGARAAHVHRCGPGPGLDGLLQQSALGIVTRATVWLMPAPRRAVCFVVRCAGDAAAGELVDALRELRLAGTVRSTVHLFNDLRLLAGCQRFPWACADGRRGLDAAHPELCAQLIDIHGIPRWAASGVLTGTRGEVAAQARELRRRLRRIAGARLTLIGPRRLALLDAAAAWLPRWRRLARARERIERVRTLTGLLLGRPSRDALAGAHWRARGRDEARSDPLASGAGLCWLAPVLPATGDDFRRVERIARPILAAHGFEYQVAYSCVADRALCAVIAIAFDAASADERERARRCHDQALAALLDDGYVPYRAAPFALPALAARAPERWRAARRLREALDPDAVLSPGRLEPLARDAVATVEIEVAMGSAGDAA